VDKEEEEEGEEGREGDRLSVSEASLRDAAVRRKQKELEAKERMVRREGGREGGEGGRS